MEPMSFHSTRLVIRTGLLDIYAVALGYSSITPLSIDADENGINDADEDLDSN
jgi:hypothetical protein